MTALLWTRIAFGLALFLAAGHTFGAVLAAPAEGTDEPALRDAMRRYRFTAMGMTRSYWDAYLGSGWTITAFILGTAALTWFLGPVAETAPALARPLLVALAGTYALVAAIGARYFVTAPIVVSALIALALGMAARAAG